MTIHQESFDGPIERFKRATTATIRAIAEDVEIDVSFAAGTPLVQGNTVRVPAPVVGCSADELSAIRGMGDEVALKLRYHDSTVHMQNRPAGGTAEELFEWVEDARVASLGSTRLEGIARNLEASLERTCKEALFDQITSEAEAPLGVAVGLVVRESLTNRALPPAAEHVAKFWREHINEQAGKDIEELRSYIQDQQAFAVKCYDILADLGLVPNLSEHSEIASQNQEPELGHEESEELVDQVGEEDGEDAEAESSTVQGADEVTDQVESGQDTEDVTALQLDEDGRIRTDVNYRIYTTRFDQVIFADRLADISELIRLRESLDEQLVQLKQTTAKLAARLQRKILALQRRTWEFDLEEGILDSSRLHQVVVDPLSPLAFKQEKEMKFRDTVVSMLVDNSGSMRGRSIIIAAMCGDILGSTLERCGVRVEVLGFTTSTWRGGRSREDWIARGKLPVPGRLNDIRHIIYKDADIPWRRSRRNLGLMMKEELLKENIDGEALIWAHNRLVRRPEQRKILMVISDGLPVDNSTLLANPSNFLEEHLTYAIEMIESHSKVQLVAIGIGHDVTKHYSRSITITEPEQLGGAMTEQLANLFEDDS